jgi:hypothetical protein
LFSKQSTPFVPWHIETDLNIEGQPDIGSETEELQIDPDIEQQLEFDTEGTEISNATKQKSLPKWSLPKMKLTPNFLKSKSKQKIESNSDEDEEVRSEKEEEKSDEEYYIDFSKDDFESEEEAEYKKLNGLDEELVEPKQNGFLQNLIQWPSIVPKFNISNKEITTPSFISLLTFKPILNAISLRGKLKEGEQSRHVYLTQYMMLSFKVYMALYSLQRNHPEEILKYMDNVAIINGISTDYPLNVKMDVEKMFYSIFKSNPKYTIDYNFALRHLLYPDIY